MRSQMFIGLQCCKDHSEYLIYSSAGHQLEHFYICTEEYQPGRYSLQEP